MIAVPASALALSTWYDLCDKIPETLPFGSSNYFQLYLQKGEAATIPSYGSPFDVEIEYQAPDSGMYTFFYTSLGSLQDTYSCLTGEKLSWDYAHCTSTEEHPETIPLILNSADTTGYTWSYLDTIQEEQTRSSACTETTATSVSYAVDATIFVYFAPAKDEDGDGYYYPYLDCFDNPAYSFSTTIYNGATELCDGRDNDCDGEVDELDPVDEDGDGYDRYRGCNRYGWPEDCKDDPSYEKAKYIYPGAPEVCDGEDNDCDGNKDGYRDLDGDGYTYSRVCWAGEDCNDSPTNGATAHPGAPEICNDNVDNDCDGETDEPNPDGINPYKVDHDGDGYFRYTWYEFGTMNCLPANYDCNDDPSNTLAPSIHPGAAEVCNGVDDDCDGLKDEGLPLIDGDGDTYYSSDSCYWLAGGRIDCVDNDPEIYPGAAEVCDGIDNDCDGQRDEDLWIDRDNDSWIDANGCVPPDWSYPLDCDDTDKDRHWYEICDGIDNDCDGMIDEIFDYDGDGAPDMRACTSPATIPDCYDRNRYVYWGAPEICDGWDNDCDWVADEGLNVDADGDGYYAAGSCKTKTEDCITYRPSPPYLTLEQVIGPCNPSPADCRDDLILVNPGATEICGDNVDNDCDPTTPDECATCEFEVSVSPSSVAPKSTSGTMTSTVSVTPVEEVPTGGCVVQLSVEPVAYSGGHDHHDATRPVGTLSQSQLTFSSGSTSAQTVTYTSGEVAGTETIVATVNETGETFETGVDVKVSVLGALQSSSYYRLTGSYGEAGVTSQHTDNHYVEAGTYDAIVNLAYEYYNSTKATLGINDISLSWGGLFDINNDWSTPHSSHRKGTDVDISVKVYDTETNNYEEILCDDDRDLGALAITYHGKLICESGGRKHIRF